MFNCQSTRLEHYQNRHTQQGWGDVEHLVSCFSDTFTKQGVQLFYPVLA